MIGSGKLLLLPNNSLANLLGYFASAEHSPHPWTCLPFSVALFIAYPFVPKLYIFFLRNSMRSRFVESSGWTLQEHTTMKLKRWTIQICRTRQTVLHQIMVDLSNLSRIKIFCESQGVKSAWLIARLLQTDKAICVHCSLVQQCHGHWQIMEACKLTSKIMSHLKSFRKPDRFPNSFLSCRLISTTILTRVLFSCEKFLDFGTVAIPFVCGKYCPIID